MYHISFINFSVEGHLGCFQVLAIINNAAMKFIDQVSLWNDWVSLGYMPRSGIAGSWGRLIPSFLRNSHTIFQSGCTSLHSHQQWRSDTLTPHSLQHKLSSVLLILAILTGVRWHLRVILICISLMIKDVEHFLKCLLAIWDSSAENSLFSFASVSIVLFCILMSNFSISL